jgi:hypothetical protein
MKKTVAVLLLAIITLLFSGIGAILYIKKGTLDKKNTTLDKNFKIRSLQDSPSNLLEVLKRIKKKHLIIYLDSGCGVCKALIHDIKKEPIIFEQYQTIILSGETSKALNRFSTSLPSSVLVYQVEPITMIKYFGGLRTPQMYVFDENIQLISSDLGIKKLIKQPYP